RSHSYFSLGNDCWRWPHLCCHLFPMASFTTAPLDGWGRSSCLPACRFYCSLGYQQRQIHFRWTAWCRHFRLIHCFRDAFYNHSEILSLGMNGLVTRSTGSFYQVHTEQGIITARL